MVFALGCSTWIRHEWFAFSDLMWSVWVFSGSILCWRCLISLAWRFRVFWPWTENISEVFYCIFQCKPHQEKLRISCLLKVTYNFPQWHKEVGSKSTLNSQKRRSGCICYHCLSGVKSHGLVHHNAAKLESLPTWSQSHSKTSAERAKKWCSILKLFLRDQSFPLCKLTLPNSRGFVSDIFSRG